MALGFGRILGMLYISFIRGHNSLDTPLDSFLDYFLKVRSNAIPGLLIKDVTIQGSLGAEVAEVLMGIRNKSRVLKASSTA